jgi:hypothetical protein
MTEYVRINRSYEVKWFPKIKKAIKNKVSSLIEILQAKGIESGLRFLNEDSTNPELTDKVSELYQEVGLRHARRSEIRLRSEKKSLGLKRFGPSQEWIDFIHEYLRLFLIEKITFDVSRTTRDELLKVINEGIQSGSGITDIVSNLQGLIFTQVQAARIVRTEVNRAANVGVLAQGNSFEYELQKGWISVHDNRTRGLNPEDHADHIHMDGLWVDWYDVFRDPRNGHELEMPGDPKAGPGDTINCRCNMTTRPKRDELGRMIPKKTRISVIRNANINNRIITI